MSKELALKQVQVPHIVIDLGDQTPLLKRAKDALELAESFTVDCPEMAQAAQDEIAQWKGQAAQIEEWRKGITRPIDLTKKAVMDFVEPITSTLSRAEDTLKRKCIDWQKAENARAERERREREEAARRERERLEAEAREKARLAAEAALEAERKAKAAQEATNAEERKRLQAEADAKAREAEEQRHAAATDLAVSQVIVAAPVEVPAAVKGMAFRGTVSFNIKDKRAVNAWFAAHPEFADVPEYPEAKLRAMYKAMGDAFAVPGIEICKDVGVASRRAVA